MEKKAKKVIYEWTPVLLVTVLFAYMYCIDTRRGAELEKQLNTNRKQTQRLESQLGRIITNNEKLAARKLWMEAITATLEDTTASRWRSSDERVAWEQVFEVNDLKIPENFLPFILKNRKVKLPKVPQ